MNLQQPHWRKPHEGEHRFPVSVVVAIVIALQFSLPTTLSLSFQGWICALEVLILIALYAVSPNRIKKHHPPTRFIGFALTTVMTLSNTVSAVKLVAELISGGIGTATQLLASGGSIWLTNVVIFSLWFWDLDRGGPGARAEAKKSGQISCSNKCQIHNMPLVIGIQSSLTIYICPSQMQVHLARQMCCL